jgi:hypothetical protein
VDNTTQLLIFILIEVSIFVTGIALVVYQQRKTNQLIEKIIYNPEYAAAVAVNMVYGFMNSLTVEGKTGKELKDAEGRQALFFGFINLCGQAAMGKVGQVMPKLRGQAKKAMEFLTVVGEGLRAFGIDPGALGARLQAGARTVQGAHTLAGASTSKEAVTEPPPVSEF